jgi:hypothetical protein
MEEHHWGGQDWNPAVETEEEEEGNYVYHMSLAESI